MGLAPYLRRALGPTRGEVPGRNGAGREVVGDPGVPADDAVPAQEVLGAERAAQEGAVAERLDTQPGPAEEAAEVPPRKELNVPGRGVVRQVGPLLGRRRERILRPGPESFPDPFQRAQELVMAVLPRPAHLFEVKSGGNAFLILEWAIAVRDRRDDQPAIVELAAVLPQH